MKTKLFLLVTFIMVTLSYCSKSVDENITASRMTTCCPPDSLSLYYYTGKQFCIRWKVSADSSCTIPYGFQVQWRQYPGLFTWNTKTVVYNSGNTIVFCDTAKVCTENIWRVRTICDTANGGTYSNWVSMTGSLGCEVKR